MSADRPDFSEVLDLLGPFAGQRKNNVEDVVNRAAQRGAKKATLKLRGKRLEGGYYIRADDLADLLESKGLMPELAKTLRKAAKP